MSDTPRTDALLSGNSILCLAEGGVSRDPRDLCRTLEREISHLQKELELKDYDMLLERDRAEQAERLAEQAGRLLEEALPIVERSEATVYPKSLSMRMQIALQKFMRI